MSNVPFIVLDSLAIFLVIIPMPWHVSAWNTATCYMMIWTVLGCIIHLVGSIVWNHSLENPAPIYCDIATKISVGLSVAIPLSSLCINRRLYNIAHIHAVTIDRAQKRRNAIIDTLIAVVCPLLFMAVHYTQQGHRYDIVEDYGCWPTTYATPLAYVFVISPPILVCTISLFYCTLTIRAFLKRRHEFNDLLRSSSSGLNPHRYFRLMALAASEIIIGLPTSLYFLITNLKSNGVERWVSWSDTHWHFSTVLYWPRYFFKVNPSLKAAFEFNRWAFPFIAFVFFAFFGLADEARANYRRAFYAVMKPFGVMPKAPAAPALKGVSGESKAVAPSARRDLRPLHLPVGSPSLPPYSFPESTFEKDALNQSPTQIVSLSSFDSSSPKPDTKPPQIYLRPLSLSMTSNGSIDDDQRPPAARSRTSINLQEV